MAIEWLVIVMRIEDISSSFFDGATVFAASCFVLEGTRYFGRRMV